MSDVLTPALRADCRIAFYKSLGDLEGYGAVFRMTETESMIIAAWEINRDGLPFMQTLNVAKEAALEIVHALCVINARMLARQARVVVAGWEGRDDTWIAKAHL